MDGRRIKFLVLGGLILVTMVSLVALGVSQQRGMYYYLSVSEFLDTPDRVGVDGYRLNGKVVGGSIRRSESGQDVEFVMSDGERSLPVAYHGIIPDTFVDRADVVVEGRLDQDGTFAATSLLAKCPSKYESADGAETEYAPAEETGSI